MSDAQNHPYNVLFLCIGNAGRSIIGEAIVNRIGGDGFRGYSAGSQPRGAAHPAAIRLLKSHGYSTEGLRPKSWDEFALPGSPSLDFVFTVGRVAGRLPVGPDNPFLSMGVPIQHRRVRAEIDAAFADTYHLLHDRISASVRSDRKTQSNLDPEAP